MNKELSKKISFLLIHEILIGCLVFPKIEKAYQNEKKLFRFGMLSKTFNLELIFLNRLIYSVLCLLSFNWSDFGITLIS